MAALDIAALLIMSCCRLIVSITIRITIVDDVIVGRRRLLLILLLLLLNSRIRRGFGSRAHHVVLIAACADGDRSIVNAICVEKSRLRCRLKLNLLRCHR